MKRVESIYPVFITKKLPETVKFYTGDLGFVPIFESTFFVLLQAPGESQSLVAFMDEVHPTSPPSPRAAGGDGAFLTIQVADAEATHNAVKAKGLPLSYPLTNEPWGQKRFAMTDPNGIWVDIVEQTAPEDGYWNEYIKMSE